MSRPALLAPFVALGLAWAAGAQSPPDSIGRLIDLEALARLEPGVTCRQFASTDPTGRGHDHGHFLRREGDRCVLAEMTGPGVIARLWSANAKGRLRVFFDGEAEPRIDCPFQDLFTGRYPPFVEPIAVHAGGGWISYFPIPYARACRVEVSGLEDPDALYYQVQYLTYPAGTAIRTFTRELPEAERAMLADVVLAWKAPLHALGFTDPGLLSLPDSLPKDPTPVVSIASRSKLDIAHLREPGTLLRLEIEPRTPSPAVLRGLVLEVTWDDAAAPSVSVPVGDLFGCGFGATPYQGLVLGWTALGGYCRFPMPWRKKARLVLHNTLAEAVSCRWHLVARPGAPPPDAGYFHAEFRSTDGVGDELYELARIEGRGKYVGVNQALQGVGDLWYLEGNERFFVDGETEPSIDGTGTEDFYNGGWYWNTGPLALALHGLNVKEEWKSNRTTPYRIQVPDAVPFERSLVARIEHGSRNEVKGAYYSSVAFWYGDAPRGVREPSPAELRQPRQWVFLPKGWTAASSLVWCGPQQDEIVRARWEDVTADYRGLERLLFQAFPVSHVEHDGPAVDLRVVALAAGREPSVYRAELQVPHDDLYTLALRLVGQPAAPPIKVAVGGTPLGSVLAQATRPMPLEPQSIGPVPLAKGVQVLELSVAAFDAPAAGIDAIRLTPASPFVRTWRVAPPVPAHAGGTVEDAMDVERGFLAPDFDPAAAGWKLLDAQGDGLDLNHIVSSKSPMLAYLTFAVHSPRQRTSRVLLGSDDGVRVWVNGELAWSREIHRHLAADEDRFDVPLRQGWNRFLVKVKNDYGGYGVTLRIADPGRDLTVAADPGAR